MKDLEVEGLAAKATQRPENDRQVSKQELSIPNNISSISCLGQDCGGRTPFNHRLLCGGIHRLFWFLVWGSLFAIITSETLVRKM
jgi:hypothetical protein